MLKLLKSFLTYFSEFVGTEVTANSEHIELVNCLTCGTGKRWWFPRRSGYKCPNCGGNPEKGDGREDWQDYSRAKMVSMHGPRLSGDAELLARYQEELKKEGWR